MKEVKVNWDKLELKWDEKAQDHYISGETEEQTQEAMKCYDWLAKNRVQPEPQPKNIDKATLDRFLINERTLNRTR